MVRRAERLYRLRKRKDASGKPLTYGDTLRLLLFVRDGWGWTQGIKDICLCGFEKSVAATIAPIRGHVRGPLDHDKAQYAVDAHDIAMTPGERHAAGLLISGEPLEGASLEGVFRATTFAGLTRPLPDWFIKFLQPLGIHDGASLAAKLFQGFSADTLRTIMSNLSDEDARLAIPKFLGFWRPFRTFVHRAAISENKKNQSTNPLSMFGHTQREVEKAFRDGGAVKRITPAQMLALFIGIHILGDTLFRYVDQVATLAVETAKKVGLKVPDSEQELLPYAMRLMQLSFARPQVPPRSVTPTT